MLLRLRVTAWLVSAALIGASVGAASALTVVLNPVGEQQSAPHGQGNIYAPEIHIERGVYRMWFGGQGKDGHDRIQLAESRDGVHWSAKGVVLDDPGANHVNDPSVVRVGGTYFMYYTRAGRDVRDEVAVATSKDGVAWTRRGTALAPSAEGGWDSLLVGRPSVLVEHGLFRMWYDGRKDLPPGAPAEGVLKSDTSVRAVGYAESRDGVKWVRPRRDPVFGQDTGGVHVSRLGGHYVMLSEAREGTRIAVSKDGYEWTFRGLLAPRSGSPVDEFGHVTPFLLGEAERKPGALYVGAARSRTWDRNVIACIQLSDAQRKLLAAP